MQIAWNGKGPVIEVKRPGDPCFVSCWLYSLDQVT